MSQNLQYLIDDHGDRTAVVLPISDYDIRSLPRHEGARVVEAVSQLSVDPLPHGSQKLSGSERT